MEDLQSQRDTSTGRSAVDREFVYLHPASADRSWENKEKSIPIVLLGAPLRGKILTKHAFFVKIASFPENIAKIDISNVENSTIWMFPSLRSVKIGFGTSEIFR